MSLLQLKTLLDKFSAPSRHRISSHETLAVMRSPSQFTLCEGTINSFVKNVIFYAVYGSTVYRIQQCIALRSTIDVIQPNRIP